MGLSSICYNKWITREELIERGFEKMVNEYDGKLAAEQKVWGKCGVWKCELRGNGKGGTDGMAPSRNMPKQIRGCGVGKCDGGPVWQVWGREGTGWQSDPAPGHNVHLL